MSQALAPTGSQAVQHSHDRGDKAMNKPTEKQIEAALEAVDVDWVYGLLGSRYGDATSAMSAALTAALAVEAGTEPRAWFVKDYADGWIYFDNEVDAQAYRAMSGSALLVAYSPDALTTSPASSDDGRCPRPCNDRPADFSMRACIEAGECGCIAFPASSAVEGEAAYWVAETRMGLVPAAPYQPHAIPLYRHPAPTPAGEWRTMDSAPKDGSRILLHMDGDVFEAHWAEGRPCYEYGWHCWHVGDEGSKVLGVPTHWQPLPAPPAPQTEDMA